MGHFLSKLDSDRIVGAIADAEKRSSGEIRVHVTHRKPENLEQRAARRFERLGMTRTAHRNGVLIYIAPKLRRFRILGDTGVHEQCGDEFLRQTASEMEEQFRRGEFNEGVVKGIEKAGELLAAHFPRQGRDVN